MTLDIEKLKEAAQAARDSELGALDEYKRLREKLTPVDFLALISALEEAKKDEDEAYELGKRDGYEKAIQDADVRLGGNGEYFASVPDPSLGCPDWQTMLARMVDRYQRLQATVTVLTEAHAIASEANRSTWQIAERDGAETNWPAFRTSLRNALETSHEALNTVLGNRP